MWMTLGQNQTQEVRAFTEHINSVDMNTKFTIEDVKDNHLPFLDYDVQIGEDRSLHIGVYRGIFTDTVYVVI